MKDESRRIKTQSRSRTASASSFILHPSPFILSAALAAALYAVTLGGTYVYDDVGRLLKDERVGDVSQWGQFLTKSYNEGIDKLYRPVTSLSYAVQAVTIGTGEGLSGAFWFHLVNVLLYAAVCWQVALLGKRLYLSRDAATEVAEFGAESPAPESEASASASGGVALAAGLLFAAHPVHAEAVASIVGRAELLCGLGMLGALLIVTHPTRPLTPGRCVAVVALMLLSVGAKEQGLVIPGLLLAWYGGLRWCGRSLGTNGNGRLLAALVTLSLAGYLLYREQILPMAWPRELLDPTIQTMRDVGGADRWLMPVALLGRSLQLLTVPWELSLDYGADVIVPPQRMDDPYLWLGFLTLVLWFAAAGHALWRRWAAGLFCLLGLAFTYLPASNGPTLIGTIYGERLLFLPSAFYVLYLVLLGARAGVPKNVGVAVVALLVLLGSVRTVTYVAQWNDKLAFYASQAKQQPKSVRLWMLLAEEARERGELDLAAAAAARATALAPGYWSHWVQRARIEADRGNFEAALQHADRAVEARTFGVTTGAYEEIVERQRAATRPAQGDARVE